MKPLLLVLALCVAQINALSVGPRPDYNDDYDDDTRNDWQPEPLKPAPWESVPQDVRPQGAVVQVPEIGQIEGVRAYKTIANRPVNAFLGLRYGKVGGGLARFQAAQPTEFQGRVNATVKSPNCAQFPELDRLRNSESRGENVDDCLTLDIYAPEGANQLPVLVFVHGEMLFDGGSEEAQPDYILENDVLLVSINYRLAPFGFLSALTDELPGNVALSDLHLALEWLQRNLVHFGGNPEKVTLVGQAGGATLVHALSLSGKASNLFQQLILQSGTALNPYLIDNQPLDTLNTFARLARCPPASPTPRGLTPLYDCLGRLQTSQLVAAFEQLLVQNERLGLTQLGGFKLVVGDPLGYLPSHPASLVTNSSRALPMIVGATKDAAAFIISRIYDQISRVQSHNVSDYIDVVLRHTAPPSEHRTWKQWALREIFNPDQEHTASLQTVANGLLELSNYILYRAPVINSIRHSYRSTPAYLYTFDYRGEHHRFGHLSNPLPFGVDASLSDDSVYLFPYPEEASRLNHLDRSLSRTLVTMWVDFAVTGVPNHSGAWPQATSEYGPFVRFTNSRQNPLELDPHFGEGIYLPNHSWVSFRPVNNTTPITTTTTTTTTSRPYVYNPYANWQNRPTQHQPNWHPADPEYVRAQEARQQQFIREREQRRREQQQRENQLRPQLESRQLQEERLRQQREQEERVRQQREQEERLRQQREQEDRVRQQREQEERVRQQKQREQYEREQQERDQQEREQQELQEREQQEREQQEREQSRQDQHPEYSPERVDSPWENSEDEQQQREQQEREQQEREQQEREQQEREHQDREQREREQQDREQREREQQEREQQEREQQERAPHHNPEDDQLPYPTYEQFGQDEDESPSESDYSHNYNEEQEREQQQQEHLRREQQEQQEREERLQREREQQERDHDNEPRDNPEDFPSYEDYIKAQEAKNAERDRIYAEEQERERQQQEQLHQERQRHPEEPQPDERQPYPSYESYDSDRNYVEEQEREQQRRDQVQQEREQQPGEDQGEEYETAPEEAGEQEQDVLKVEDFPTYEAYLEAATKLRAEQEEQEKLEEERYRAQQEEEDRIQAERERNSHYA